MENFGFKDTQHQAFAKASACKASTSHHSFHIKPYL